MTDLLALGQSYDYLQTGEVALKIWIKNDMHQTTTKHNVVSEGRVRTPWPTLQSNLAEWESMR